MIKYNYILNSKIKGKIAGIVFEDMIQISDTCI